MGQKSLEIVAIVKVFNLLWEPMNDNERMDYTVYSYKKKHKSYSNIRE